MAERESFLPVSQPIHCRPAAFDLFQAQLGDMETVPALTRAAIAVAMHELPDVQPDTVEAEIRAVAQHVARRVKSSRTEATLAHLHEVLFEEYGFAGNTDDYYNPLNSYLPAVLKTKRGIPITLALLYKAVAEQLQIPVKGISAPGHFLVGVELIAGRPLMIVDPFFAGRILTRDEAYERIEQVTGSAVDRNDDPLQITTHRLWIARILQNLQNVFAYHKRHTDLAAMMELSSLL
jgi:regulator of sirC expression with transglutaminase-like and TPR domain